MSKVCHHLSYQLSTLNCHVCLDSLNTIKKHRSMISKSKLFIEFFKAYLTYQTHYNLIYYKKK